MLGAARARSVQAERASKRPPLLAPVGELDGQGTRVKLFREKKAPPHRGWQSYRRFF